MFLSLVSPLMNVPENDIQFYKEIYLQLNKFI